jgi:hypothetical protein
MPDDTNKIIIGSDGLPRARSVDEFNRLSEEEKAQLLYAHQKTWERGGSGAVPTSARSVPAAPAPPKPFDADDTTIRDDWRPSPEQLLGTKFNEWK